jgi:hypothetical protein
VAAAATEATPAGSSRAAARLLSHQSTQHSSSRNQRATRRRTKHFGGSGSRRSRRASKASESFLCTLVVWAAPGGGGGAHGCAWGPVFHGACEPSTEPHCAHVPLLWALWMVPCVSCNMSAPLKKASRKQCLNRPAAKFQRTAHAKFQLQAWALDAQRVPRCRASAATIATRHSYRNGVQFLHMHCFATVLSLLRNLCCTNLIVPCAVLCCAVCAASALQGGHASHLSQGRWW